MEKQIFGGLIEFQSEDEFLELTKKLDVPNSLGIIEAAIKYGQKSGFYSLEESHALYKSLIVLKK